MRAVAGWVWVMSACTTSAVGYGQVAHPEKVCTASNLKHSITVDGYVFRVYQTSDFSSEDDGACFQILRDGKVVFRRTIDSPQGYTLGQRADAQNRIPAIANGTDITGRGRPDMTVSYYTGGAHCCIGHYVFELEPKLTLLATIDGRDDDLAHFEKLEDGKYYYVGADWTFAYWGGSYAGSPSHEVVLRWEERPEGAGFHLALDKMRKPAPTDKEWENALGDVRGAEAFEVRTYLWGEVMDLIYTGHADLAWKFLGQVPPEVLSRPDNPSLEDFCSTLRHSPYWPDLESTMKGAPKECLNAKARKKD